METGERKSAWLPFVLIIIVVGLGAAFLALHFLRKGGDSTRYVPPEPASADGANGEDSAKTNGETARGEREKTKKPPKPPPEPEKESQPEPDPETQALSNKLEAKRQEVRRARSEIKAIRGRLRELEGTNGGEARKKVRALKGRKLELESLLVALDAELSLLRSDLQKRGVDPGPKIEAAAPIYDPPEIQREHFTQLRREVEKLKIESRFYTAREKLVAAYEDLPVVHSRLDSMIEDLRNLLRDAERAFDRKIGEAKDLLENGDYPAAMKALALALSYVPDVPEKNREASRIEDRIRRRALFEDMVRVRGGEVTLGDPERPDEPVRTVTLETFRIDKFEVTNQQYYLYVLATGADPPLSWARGTYDPEKARYPVFGVTLEEARGFAKWAGKRLPTEDEWERAARYIDGRTWPWGDKAALEDSRIPCHCLDSAVDESGRVTVSEVGKYPNGDSPEGVSDLAGNVWEWTSTAVDKGGRKLFVLKGGSFLTPPEACRGSNRLLDDPELGSMDVGFRCVMDAE